MNDYVRGCEYVETGWWVNATGPFPAAAALIGKAVLALAWIAGQPTEAYAQAAPAIVVDLPLGSLKSVPTPEPSNLSPFLQTDASGNVRSAARAVAIALGKALFWDSAVGSDGQACTSCHLNAGADSRTRNQLNPGFRAIPADTTLTPPFAVRIDNAS